MAKDPLCGTDVTDTNYSSTKFGTTYYFCSKQCKSKFENSVKERKIIPVALVIGLIIISVLSYVKVT